MYLCFWFSQVYFNNFRKNLVLLGHTLFSQVKKHGVELPLLKMVLTENEVILWKFKVSLLRELPLLKMVLTKNEVIIWKFKVPAFFQFSRLFSIFPPFFRISRLFWVIVSRCDEWIVWILLCNNRESWGCESVYMYVFKH